MISLPVDRPPGLFWLAEEEEADLMRKSGGILSRERETAMHSTKSHL